MRAATIKYRSKRWFNIKKRKIVFGLEAKIDGKWHPVCEDNKPLIYGDRAEAIKKVKDLNKKQDGQQDTGTNKG